MTSIGNDIVALDTIDKQRTGDYRFYSKILSPSEQELYNLPHVVVIPFYVYVWLLWSAKESVYKYLKRLQPNLTFSPVQITVTEVLPLPKTSIINLLGNVNCQPDGLVSEPNELSQAFTDASLLGITLQISYQGNSYHARSIINQDFIATVASNSVNFDNIYWGIKQIDQSDYETQSAAVRDFFLEDLSKYIPGTDFRITKSPFGFPIILDSTNETDIKVSFAHHGKYVAYALNLSI